MISKPYYAYDDDGSVRYVYYMVGSMFHKVDGPAIISYHGDGSVHDEYYYIFGRKISKEEFETPGFVDSFILENS